MTSASGMFGAPIGWMGSDPNDVNMQQPVEERGGGGGREGEGGQFSDFFICVYCHS